MVIYTGRAPAYKLIVTEEMLHKGQDKKNKLNFALFKAAPIIRKHPFASSFVQAVWVSCWPAPAPR